MYNLTCLSPVAKVFFKKVCNRYNSRLSGANIHDCSKMSDLIYAVRGSFGFCVNRGITEETQEEIICQHLDPKSSICRSLKFSNAGKYLCYCDSTRTVLIESATGRELFAADLGKTSHIIFSPRDSIMVTYEPYVIYGSRMNADGTTKTPNPNLRFWSVPDGRLISTVVSEKQSQWKPQFTDDESIALRLSGSEILFYENCQFERFVKRLSIKNLESFVVSPGINPHVLCFQPPLKGLPAMIQLRKLSLEGDLQIVSTKTSFNCDKCTMMWNSRGTAALATATVEVDTSNKSYYGVSHLYIISTKTTDTTQVHLDKNGPLHDVKWSPTGKEFVVVYGFMPSKVAVYNLKGDAVWQQGEGHRNEAHYNPFGSILAICSFGNISSGRIEFWNTAKKELIGTYEVPSTTAFEWSPDGDHFITATTAPRLRISNGYRIWHYTAKCLKEVSYDKEGEKKEELWQVVWKPSNSFSKTEITNLTPAQKEAMANNVVSSNHKHPVDNMKPGIIKKGAYVPPHMRKPELNKPQGQLPLRPQISDREKKITSIEKKLKDINKLKEKKAGGGLLEQNQLTKIQNEHSLLEELQELMIASSEQMA